MSVSPSGNGRAVSSPARPSAALDAMARRLYGWTKAEAQAELSCVRCRNTVRLVEVPEVDRREYELSGICPTCWAELFPPEDAS